MPLFFSLLKRRDIFESHIERDFLIHNTIIFFSKYGTRPLLLDSKFNVCSVNIERLSGNVDLLVVFSAGSIQYPVFGGGNFGLLLCG